MKELLVLANEHARVLGALSALAQDRHNLSCPPHRLFVTDAAKVAHYRLRQRADGNGALLGGHVSPLLAII